MPRFLRPGKEHQYAKSAERRGSVAGERARVYIDGYLQIPPEETQPNTKWRCGDEAYPLVSIGGVFGGGIADPRDGNGAESV
jgi:hypothetical protein